MVLNSFSSGVNTSFSTELNENTRANQVLEVYTGSGFDVSLTNVANSTATSSHELTAVDSSSLGAADYLVIKATVFSDVSNEGSAGGRTRIQIETKEVGGSYSDSLSTRTVLRPENIGDSRATQTIFWYHTLTAGEKSNGVQVRITGTAQTSNNAASDCDFNNLQTVVSTSG